MRLIAVDIGNSSIKLAIDSPDMTDNWEAQLAVNARNPESETLRTTAKKRRLLLVRVECRSAKGIEANRVGQATQT